MPRPLRQTRTRKPFPESLPLDENCLKPVETCCPDCGAVLSFLGEDTAEQLELMRSAFRVIRTVREKHACKSATSSCRHLRRRAPSSVVSPGRGFWRGC